MAGVVGYLWTDPATGKEHMLAPEDVQVAVVEGRMETAVHADLGRMGRLDTGVQGSLAEAALILARAIDSYSAAAKTPAELSAIAKAVQELRTTLGRLVESTDDNRPAAAGGTTPVWSDGAAVRDAPEPGPADVGAADRGGGAAAG